MNDDNVICFDSFGVELITKENKKIISNKIIKTNVYRINANDSIICGHFILSSPNECRKNDKIILKYFH